eukprot:m.699202 g.699202  ORF g.699202 m.699202 type:complete len:727 (-) comp58690_c0_seq1:1606-3786(-)
MAAKSEAIKYPKEIANLYNIKETIGAGGFAKVKSGRHKITGEKVAIKIMEKSRLRETNDLPRASLEIKALKELIHPHISRLYQALETEDRFYIVMEFAPGGELFDYIVAKDRLKEDEARGFFRQIISSVGYMHSRGYVHRDLKPENLLLDADQSIKLIDFGLVGYSVNLQHEMLKTCCGSAAYAAPELIRGERYIGPPADMWSLGILLYALLCGFLPYDHDDTQKLYRLIQRGVYEIPAWLSHGSQDIIASLLKHKPEQRITMDALLKHTWVTNGGKLPPVDIFADYHAAVDLDVISEMGKFYGSEYEEMNRSVRKWEYDEVTVLYELLKSKHLKGQPIRLPANKSHLPATQAMAFISSKPPAQQLGSNPNLFAAASATPAAISIERSGSSPNALTSSLASDAKPPQAPSKPTDASPSHPQSAPQKKPSLVVTSDNGDVIQAAAAAASTTPVVSSVSPLGKFTMPTSATPPAGPPPFSSAHTTDTAAQRQTAHVQATHGRAASVAVPGTRASISVPNPSAVRPGMSKTDDAPPSPTKSRPRAGTVAVPSDDSLARSKVFVSQGLTANTGLDKAGTDAPTTLGGSALDLSAVNRRASSAAPSGLRGSLQRLTDSIMSAFGSSRNMNEPQIVKGLFNVSTTSTKDPHTVLRELKGVLASHGNIKVEENGFLLKAKTFNIESGKHELTITFEVCIIARMDITGIKLKRIKGDTWQYKKACQDLLHEARL